MAVKSKVSLSLPSGPPKYAVVGTSGADVARLVFGADGCLVDANNAACKLLSRPRTELLTLTFETLLEVRDGTLFEALFESVRSQGAIRAVVAQVGRQTEPGLEALVSLVLKNRKPMLSVEFLQMQATPKSRRRKTKHTGHFLREPKVTSDGPLAMIELDDSGSVRYASTVALQLSNRMASGMAGLLAEPKLKEAIELAKGDNCNSDTEFVWADRTFEAHITRSDDVTGLLIILLDVTDRRIANQTAQRISDLLFAIYEAPAVGLIVADLDLTILDVNSHMAEILMTSKSDLIGKSVADITHPDDQLVGRDMLAELRDGVRSSCIYRKRYVRSDGADVHVELHVSVFPRGTAAPTMFVAVLRDITQEHNQRLELELQTKMLEAQFEMSPLMQAVLSADGRFERVNSRLCAVFGVDAESIVGAYLSDWMVEADQVIDRVRSSEATSPCGGSAPQRASIRRTDGSTVSVSGFASLCPKSDGGEQIQLQLLDRTPLREAELKAARFRQAAEASPSSIIITDPEGTILYVNRAFETVTGYLRDEAIGKNPRILKSGVNAPELYADLWKTITSGKVWTGTLQNRKKSGQFYWEDIVIYPLLGSSGQIVNFVASKVDVTASLQRRREIEAMSLLGLRLRDADTVDEALLIVADVVALTLEATEVAIVLKQEAAPGGIVRFATGWWASSVGFQSEPNMPCESDCLLSGRLPIVESFVDDSLLKEQGAWKQGYSAIAVPLMSSGSHLGTIWAGKQVTMTHPSRLEAMHVQLASASAGIVSGVLKRLGMIEEARLRIQRVFTLQEMEAAMLASTDLQVTVNILIDRVMSLLQCDAVRLMTRHADAGVFELLMERGFVNELSQHYRAASVSDVHSRITVERDTQSIADLRIVDCHSSFAKLRSMEELISYHGAPLMSRGKVIGVLEVFDRRVVDRDPEWLQLLRLVAGQFAIALENSGMFDKLERMNAELVFAYDGTIEGWSRALDFRDEETEGHSRRVTELTIRLCREAGAQESQIPHIRRGALLHDIGKMGIPDAILLKPGPLTPEEWVIMKKHPAMAYDMLSSIPYLKPALAIPHFHHEKWDGTGYPTGLAGEQIPFEARAFSIVDVYDALSSDRPYRKAWPNDRIRAYIRENAGTYFDPSLVHVFLERVIH